MTGIYLPTLIPYKNQPNAGIYTYVSSHGSYGYVNWKIIHLQQKPGSQTSSWPKSLEMNNFNFEVVSIILQDMYPRHPVIFSDDDWDVQSPPQHSMQVPLPFSEGDWIPRGIQHFFRGTKLP